MKDAIDTALAALGADKTKIDTIQIIGSVTEITQWNWRHLRELYHINSDWSNLYRLDLSGITGLKDVYKRQDIMIRLPQHMIGQKRQDHRPYPALLNPLCPRTFKIPELQGFIKRCFRVNRNG